MSKQLTIFDKPNKGKRLLHTFKKECEQHYNVRTLTTSAHCYLARQKVYKYFVLRFGKATVQKTKFIKRILDKTEIEVAKRVNGKNYMPPNRNRC